MKKIMMLLLFLLFPVISAHAQMSTQDTYQSVTTDGTYLYTSVTLEGQIFSNISIPAVHTYTNTSTLNGVVKQLTGQGRQGQYVSITNQQELAFAAGVDYEWETDETIVCNYMGEFFSTTSSHGVGIRSSAYSFYGWSNGLCAWVPTCAGKCSSQHTTIPFPNGLCYPIDAPYKQCYDITYDGRCSIYRAICYSKKAPGICTQ